MTKLARVLQEGASGVGADPVRAIQLLERAIDERDFYKAMIQLAVMLNEGAEGVQNDSERAEQLFERAVAIVERFIGKYENVIVLNELEFVLVHGGARVADPARAVQLFLRAIKQGREESMVHLALLLTTGAERVPADRSLAMELCTQVIEEGKDRRLIRLASDELAALQQSLNDASAIAKRVDDAES